MVELTKEYILSLLEEVKDPEIPVISLVDLGVITDIVIDQGKVDIHMTPTFVGCPAIDYMEADIKEVLTCHGIKEVTVHVTFETSWNSNRITEKGRQALRKFGLAPPPKHDLIIDIDIISHAICPVCGNEDTVIKNAFGPTACRSIHYCPSCEETFEQFKPI